jgi:hypothetical protein
MSSPNSQISTSSQVQIQESEMGEGELQVDASKVDTGSKIRGAH